MDERKIISLEEFKAKSEQVIAITGFNPGEVIYVKVRKISILGLASKGRIPNQLMGQVTKMFGGGGGHNSPNTDELSITEMAKVLDLITAEALVEPAYDDVKDYLSDEQKNDIFNWTQTGVEALASFREEAGDSGLTGDVQEIPMPTIGSNENN